MRDTVEDLPITVGKTTTYGGAIGAFVSGWTISEIGVVVGIVVGVLGMIFGQYWAWRRMKREAAEQEVRLTLEYGLRWREIVAEANAATPPTKRLQRNMSTTLIPPQPKPSARKLLKKGAISCIPGSTGLALCAPDLGAYGGQHAQGV